MITYSWQITDLSCYPEYMGQTDVVFSIFASYTGTDDTNLNFLGFKYSAIINIKQDLIIGDSTTFTPYADLTEEQVLGWLLASLSPQQIDEMQINITEQIDAQIAADNKPPIVQLPLPWSN